MIISSASSDANKKHIKERRHYRIMDFLNSGLLNGAAAFMSFVGALQLAKAKLPYSTKRETAIHATVGISNLTLAYLLNKKFRGIRRYK